MRYFTGRFLFSGFILLIFSNTTFALEQFGRISAGGYVAKEDFYSNSDGAASNDAQSATGRIFYRISDMGSDKVELVADLRDKYDFFGKLNSTQQQLDPLNKLQTRSAFISNFPSENRFNYKLGRFSLVESGGTFTDGLAVQKKFSKSIRLGIFGGMNPYSDSTQLVDYSSNSTDYGTYFAYEPTDLMQDKNLIVNYGYVTNQYNAEVDRRYLYQSIYYQWQTRSRILTACYLDFIPTSKLQTGTFNYDQKVGERQDAHLHLLAIDTITYRRLQNVRSTLPASSYNQAELSWDFLLAKASSITPIISYGRRDIDGLTKQENKILLKLNDFANSKYDANSFVGYRRNFSSTDYFLGGGVGYYSMRWEWGLDLQLAKEDYSNKTLNPVQGGFSVSYLQSNQLYWVFSFEAASDENVVYYAGYGKVTYRFGSKETPPLRDGAPNRGAL